MACFFVCAAGNNATPIKLKELPIHQPLPRSILNHIRNCPDCRHKYKPALYTTSKDLNAFRHIQSALYLTREPSEPSYSFSNENSPASTPLRPQTPKTPKIDPECALSIKHMLKYSPSRSGTYTTNSPHTSLLVEVKESNHISKDYGYSPSKSSTISTIDTIPSSISLTNTPQQQQQPQRPSTPTYVSAMHDLNDLFAANPSSCHAALSTIFSDPKSNITSKNLPPPIHRFNKLQQICENSERYVKTRNESLAHSELQVPKAHTPSNSPKAAYHQVRDLWADDFAQYRNKTKISIHHKQDTKRMEIIQQKLKQIKEHGKKRSTPIRRINTKQKKMKGRKFHSKDSVMERERKTVANEKRMRFSCADVHHHRCARDRDLEKRKGIGLIHSHGDIDAKKSNFQGFERRKKFKNKYQPKPKGTRAVRAGTNPSLPHSFRARRRYFDKECTEPANVYVNVKQNDNSKMLGTHSDMKRFKRIRSLKAKSSSSYSYDYHSDNS